MFLDVHQFVQVFQLYRVPCNIHLSQFGKAITTHRLIMALCEYCKNIPAKLFSYRRDDQCDYDHHLNLDDLQKSAAAGCQGCSLFRHCIESGIAEHAGKYAIERTWDPNERIHLSSTKFGWQVVRVGWREAGHFRTGFVPLEWSMCIV